MLPEAAPIGATAQKAVFGTLDAVYRGVWWKEEDKAAGSFGVELTKLIAAPASVSIPVPCLSLVPRGWVLRRHGRNSVL